MEQLLTEAVHHASRGALSEVFEWYHYGDHEFVLALERTSSSKKLASRIRLRQAAKRALVLYRDACEPFVQLYDLFAYDYTAGAEDANSLDENSGQFVRGTAFKIWDSLSPADPIRAPEISLKLKNDIKSHAIRVRSLLDDGFDSSACAPSDVFLGLASRVRLKAPKEVLVRQRNSIRRSVEWTKAEELSDSERVSKAVDYIYCDPEWTRFVRIATARVLYDFSTVGTSQGVLEDVPGDKTFYEPAEISLMPRLKLNLSDISGRIGFGYEELVSDMESAALVGYFSGAERVVPLNSQLTADASELAEMYKGFLGERGWHVTSASAEQFLRQFPVALRADAVRLLRGGTILNRQKMFVAGRKIVADIEKESAASKILFCRFSPNSGDYTGMLFEADTRTDYITKGYGFTRSLDELERAIEASPDSIVVFLDDQFATGSQAEAQLRQWAGQSRDQWPIEIRGEQNIDLSRSGPSFRASLANGHVSLVFAFGTEGGKTRIEGAAAQLGFVGVKVRYHWKLEPKTGQMTANLEPFLREVGESVLRFCREPEGAAEASETAKRDALGYGNTASVLVTPNNVPSHVITALWCPGIYKGQPWLPLFLRRGYRRHLVLC